MILILAAMMLGPISKFDDRAPRGEWTSASKINDIERCLIDMKDQGVPIAYRQPDRPDRVTLIWTDGATADTRVDLQQTDAGTRVRTWNGAAQVLTCAPR